MSLERKDLELVLLTALDRRRLPNDPEGPQVVVNIIEGHYYNIYEVHNTGSSNFVAGNLGKMASSHRHRPSTTQDKNITPPPSDQDAADAAHPNLAIMSEAPPEYRTRDYDWFTPGRYFKIWAREGDNVDIEIHDKEFILLDTKNIEGPGLLVRRHITEHCEGHRGSFNRTHVGLQNYQAPISLSRLSSGTQSRQKTVYMDEEEDDVAEDTFIELEHTYNIPFVKYKCIDYGVLTRSSLRDLRRFYVEWLKYHWDMD